MITLGNERVKSLQRSLVLSGFEGSTRSGSAGAGVMLCCVFVAEPGSKVVVPARPPVKPPPARELRLRPHFWFISCRRPGCSLT